MKFLEVHSKKIAFTDEGTGPCVVLLHGYTESSKIWKKFDEILSRSFRVITVDLPGFGKSECVAEVHTMEVMADVVWEILHAREVSHCLMVGHSMGGFVTLSFARKYPEMLRGICLFNSHPYADSEEAKQNRDRSIKVIRENHQNYIFQFIPDLFAPQNREKHGDAIRKLIKQASKTSVESLVAATEGMKMRPDSSELLMELEVPVLFIVGMKDSRAPLNRISEMILLPRHAESLILKEMGHMGYLEAFEETLQTVWCFAKKILGR